MAKTVTETPMKQIATTRNGEYFMDVAMYTIGGFGASRTDCRELVIIRGVKYAQYNNAIEIVFLEKGKRTIMKRTLTDCKYLMIARIKDAIPVPSEFDNHAVGKITRYSCYDPRWAKDWAEQSKDVPALVLIKE